MPSEEVFAHRSIIPIDRLLNIEANVKGQTSIEALALGDKRGALFVRAVGADPMDWVIPEHCGHLSAGWPSKCLKDLKGPYFSHAAACAVAYNEVFQTRKPLAHVIEHDAGDWQRHYIRLIVPTLNAEGVFYATRPLIPARFKGVPENA